MPRRLSRDYRATKKVVSPNRLPAASGGARFMAGMGVGLVYLIGCNYAASVWNGWTSANKGPQRGRGRMP